MTRRTMICSFLGGLLGLFKAKADPVPVTKKVYFFGGYASTIDQVNSWAAVAKKMRPEYEFDGRHYISRHDGEEGAVEDAKGQIKAVVDDIESSMFCEITIIGHSSGCAVANEVARQVRHRVKKLVVLDGFCPSEAFQKEVPTECWYATNGRIFSLNASEMQKQLDPKKHTNPYVHSLWALHFSLINGNVDPDLAFKDYPKHGYDNVSPMLDYLP